MKPISFKDLAKYLDLSQPSEVMITGFAIDSRRLQPGDLFFALTGSRCDGHNFIEVIANQGAAGAIVREDYRGPSYGIPLLYVPNVLVFLQNLARKILEKRASKVIAVTGSVGKTTVKGFITTLMQSSFKIFSSPLSYNSQVTLPLSILLADGTEDYLILEMGMSNKGDLKNLISIAPPDIAIITTVAIQHAVNFSDGLAGISREKASIFSHPKTELGFLHQDIEYFKEVYSTGSCRKNTFSITSKQADYYLEVVTNGVRIYPKENHCVEIPLSLPMKAHYQNFLAAVAIARALNISWSLIRKRAAFIQLPPMRFEKIVRQGVTFINDAYNANPDSMKAALENLPKAQIGNKVIGVLSEMNALGTYTEEAHALIGKVALKYIDHLMCLGDYCKIMHKIWLEKKKHVEFFETREALEFSLVQQVKPGDIVLLKGARVYELEKILNHPAFHQN